MARWLLLVFVPLSLAVRYAFDVSPLWVFATGIAAILPLANWIRIATEHLAERAGPAIGGLLNVTFGNTAELVLALFVLIAGHGDVVKGQITGSIIGNGLLGLGLAAVIGGWRREHQEFNRERVGLLSSMFVLVVIALLVPALFDYTERDLAHGATFVGLEERLSLSVSLVLLTVYAVNLCYTLFWRRDAFKLENGAERGAGTESRAWTAWVSVAVLAGATVMTAVEAELVSGALEPTARSLGLTPFFLGVVVLALVGNAPEYLSAVYFARRDRMGLVMTVTVGPSIQVALLVAPVLVIASFLLGRPMTLVFANPLELIAIAGTAFTVKAIAEDGRSTWFEGVLLIAAYAVLALAFFFATV